MIPPGAAHIGWMLVVLGSGAGCTHQSGQMAATREGHNTLTAAESVQGWRLLFDGETTSGWRGFRAESISGGWQAIDGALTRIGGGGDIVTVDEFENFELTLEWRVNPGGNSGIFYRVSEEVRRTFESGPEMQVLDDERHPDGRSRLTSAGANYGLHPSREGALRPAGEWNAVRILVDGAHVEHWLNGVKVVEYELWAPEWETLVRNSKFVEWPDYGRARRGRIALQDHGDWVAYRNIKIRTLPSTDG